MSVEIKSESNGRYTIFLGEGVNRLEKINIAPSLTNSTSETNESILKPKTSMLAPLIILQRNQPNLPIQPQPNLVKIDKIKVEKDRKIKGKGKGKGRDKNKGKKTKGKKH